MNYLDLVYYHFHLYVVSCKFYMFYFLILMFSHLEQFDFFCWVLYTCSTSKSLTCKLSVWMGILFLSTHRGREWFPLQSHRDSPELLTLCWIHSIYTNIYTKSLPPWLSTSISQMIILQFCRSSFFFFFPLPLCYFPIQ